MQGWAQVGACGAVSYPTRPVWILDPKVCSGGTIIGMSHPDLQVSVDPAMWEQVLHTPLGWVCLGVGGFLGDTPVRCARLSHIGRGVDASPQVWVEVALYG